MALAGTWACIEDVPYQWTLKYSIQSHSAPSFGTGRFHRSFDSCICLFSLVIFYKLYHGKSSPSRPTIWENLFVASLFPFGSWPGSRNFPEKSSNQFSHDTSGNDPSLRRCHRTRIYEVEQFWLTEILQVGWDFAGWICGDSCWKSCVHGCRFVPGIHFRKQEKTQMVPFAGSKCWWVSRVWRLDSGPNLQPCHGS